MNSERLEEIAALFDAMIDLDQPDRRACLDEHCDGDPDLRRQVEALLEQEVLPDDPLEEPLVDQRTLERATQPPQDLAGTCVGPYHMVRRLGHGGMGEVYLATRDLAEFEHRVALKLIDARSSQKSIERFHRERRALARLSHPNIAALIDGGVAPDGRPYLVMEYVDGQPIDEYIREHRLNVRARLELFQHVCRAVQFAHENLIVHRDIKPGNILVTTDGTPKLLDFGIAKVLEPQGTMPSGVTTATIDRMMTPDYASPEQVRGAPITTASDVYSLGVVCYESLAERRPYCTAGATPAEIERIVCEESPPRPSAAVAACAPRAPKGADVATSRSHGAATTKSTSRQRRELRGDLDTIVLKAMRKDPDRRYRNAERLGADIDRYLRGLPITARKDTLRYRAAKFVHRNTLSVSAAAIIIVLLVGGTLGIGWQAFAARDAERRATAEAASTARVSEFLAGLFLMADPTKRGEDPPTLRELLDRGARQIELELTDEPAVKGTLLNTMGCIYRNLGVYDEAAKLLQRSLEIRRDVFGAHSVEAAEVLNNIGLTLRATGDNSSAMLRFQESLAIYRRRDGSMAGEIAALVNLGLTSLVTGELDRAAALVDESLRLIETHGADDVILHADVLDAAGSIRAEHGDLAAAEALYRRSIVLREDQSVDTPAARVTTLNNLGAVLVRQGRYADAIGNFEESLALRRKIYGDAHPALIAALANLAALESKIGRYQAAEQLLREALGLATEVLPPAHATLGDLQYNLATVLVERGLYEDAEQGFRRALVIWRDLYGSRHLRVARGANGLGRALARQDRIDEAETHLRDAMAIAEAFGPPGAQIVGEVHHNLALLASRRGDRAAAERHLRDALAICYERLGERHPVAGLLLSDLGETLLAQGDVEGARDTLEEAYAIQLESLGEEHPQTMVTKTRIEELTDEG